MDVDYKFRISCRMRYETKPEMREFEFQYETLRMARRNYKAILLDLYKKKGLLGFEICLNRSKDNKWCHSIFEEMVN